MQNFYKLLNLKPSADIYKIQAALKAAAQSGKFQIETLTEIRDTLYDAEKRRAYNAALRQEDPVFLKKTKKRLPAVMMRKKAAVLPFRAATAAAATLKPLF